HDWLKTGISTFTRGDVKLVFYDPFRPLAPPADVSTLPLIDSLHGLVDTMDAFSWMSDIQYNIWLSRLLDTATTSIVSGDSLTSARRIKLFQQSVDKEY